MYQTLRSTLSADEKLSRFIKQATLNVSQHFCRLSLLTEGFTLPVDNYEGFERDYLVSVLYSINENLAVLNFAGAKELTDALFLNMLDGREWYDEAISSIHEAMMEDPAILEDMDDFEEKINVLNPPPPLEPPMADELGDDEALSVEEREALKADNDKFTTSEG